LALRSSVPIDPNHRDFRDLTTPEYYAVQQILTIFHNKHETRPLKKKSTDDKSDSQKVAARRISLLLSILLILCKK
jgi:hypothetical protein